MLDHSDSHHFQATLENMAWPITKQYDNISDFRRHSMATVQPVDKKVSIHSLHESLAPSTEQDDSTLPAEVAKHFDDFSREVRFIFAMWCC